MNENSAIVTEYMQLLSVIESSDITNKESRDKSQEAIAQADNLIRSMTAEQKLELYRRVREESNEAYLKRQKKEI